MPGRHRRRPTGTAQQAPTVGSEELPTLGHMSILERGAAGPCSGDGRTARETRPSRRGGPARGRLRRCGWACCWSPTGGWPTAASSDLGGWASGLTSIGRLTGLVASVLLLAQVVLMARVPGPGGAFGQDRLAHLHRLVGFTSFNLMLAHIVAITWGYAAGELGRTPATLWDLVADYPGHAAGHRRHRLPGDGGRHQRQGRASTAPLRVLAPAAPLRLPRRRPGPAAPAVDRAAVHVLTGAAPCSGGRPGRVAAAAVLLWRVGLPVRRNLRHRLRVTSVVPRGRRHRVGVRDRPPPGPAATSRPGSSSPGGSSAGAAGPAPTRTPCPPPRTAAASGSPCRPSVTAAPRLFALRPGTRALVEGPYGRLSARARTRPKVALIGAGVGITPLRALAEGLDYAPGDAVILQRYTTSRSSPASSTCSRRERGSRCCALPGTATRPRLLAR